PAARGAGFSMWKPGLLRPTGIVNEKLLSDYLHHVFPSTKLGPTVASLRYQTHCQSR
uniref:Uncharacterized protein n=1 Tax=Poecilia mexicana TaxID=48701 RepID=A0A3B3YYG1_9TELE